MMSCVLPCCLSETTIGIIIGSCFTLVGVFANGVITYFLNRDTHNREVKERKRCEQKKEDDEKRAKREKAYWDFMNYYGFMGVLGGLAYGVKDNPAIGEKMGIMFAEKYKENVLRASEILSEVLLYGSPDIVKECQKFSVMWNNECHRLSSDDSKDRCFLDEKLLEVVDKMKKELGLGSL